MVLSTRCRHFVFTHNNYDPIVLEQYRTIFNTSEVKYAIFGKEVGENGTPHLQGYCSLQKRKTFDAVKAWLPDGRHIEAAKGNAHQNRTYCSKEGAFEEFGELPAQGKRSDLDAVCAMVKDGASIQEIAEEHPNQIVRYGRGIAQLKLHLEEKYTHHECRGVWIYGPPGTGKSHTARAYDEGAYVKPQNKWWDGYQGEETVILDDLDTPTLGHYLKIWADKYSCSGETKGGTMQLRHKKLIVTSNYSPEELWPDNEIMAAAVRRRFRMNHKTRRDQITNFNLN
ncbi:MAG: putative viral replication protein [Circular genetic element sp.]|nr:MAG: putative viral replication protein [Circular genetic element sp.]